VFDRRVNDLSFGRQLVAYLLYRCLAKLPGPVLKFQFPMGLSAAGFCAIFNLLLQCILQLYNYNIVHLYNMSTKNKKIKYFKIYRSNILTGRLQFLNAVFEEKLPNAGARWHLPA
jgi:hypothetical protein